MDAAKYRLVVAIEAAVSICTHVAARIGSRSPDSYADCFLVLASAGWIDTALAERLGRLARFRKLLVHVYWQVDDGRAWEVLRHDLRDLEAYLEAIGRRLQEPG